MACACKAAKNVETNLFGTKNNTERKGFIGVINRFATGFFNKLILMMLILILTPIVILLMLYNFLIGDELVVSVPKFITKFINKKKNE